MSGFIGGLFGGSSGSAKTDRKAQLTSFGDLQNVFNTALPLATSETAKGNKTVDDALSSLGLSGDYFKKILSGDRTATASAVEPTTLAATEQGDALKRQSATMGTARGGGTAGVNQQIDDKTRGITDKAIAESRPQAAAGLTDVASRVGGIGTAELSAAMNALGISANAAGTLGGLSGDARKSDVQNQKDMGASLGNLALWLLGM